MLNKNTKKLIALGVSLATLAGAMPAIISPIPVFASEDGAEQSPFDSANANLDNELAKVEFSSATKQEDIDSILKDFSYETTTGTAVTIKATTKDGSFSNDESKSTCSFSVELSDGNDSKSFDYSYTYEKVTPVKVNLLTTLDGADENVYGTIITLTTDFWGPLEIAGVKCSPNNDPDLEVTQLKSATSFTGGYELISADVEEFTNTDKTTYKKVVVKLGLTKKLTDFPMDIATFDGKALEKDQWGNIFANSWAISAKMETFDVQTPVGKSELQALYDLHKADTQGNYTDNSWEKFTTELTAAQTVLGNKDATQADVTTAKTNLDAAITGLVKKAENQYGTIITLTTDFWGPLEIAGVKCSPNNDPDLEVTQLKAATSFTGGYELISADVEEFTNTDKTTYKKVVVKLGLTKKLTDFPMDITTFDGKALEKDQWGNIFADSWAISAKMETFDVEPPVDEKVAVTKITVDGTDAINVSGGNIALKASVSPENATNKDVTWSIVSGGTLASLSDAGVLTASKSGDGSVVVRATAKDGSGINGEKTITISNNTIISPSPSTGGGGGGSHKRSTNTTSDTKTASETKSAETVVKSTDESSIVNAIKGAKTVVINASNAGTTANTTLISAQVLSALKTNTDTTLVIKNETSTFEVKAIAEGQVQFTENKLPLTGVKNVGNNEYYLNDNGIMQTGWKKLSDGTWNHFNLETGVKEKGWFKDASTGKLYYLDDTTGAMKTGWLSNGGSWYYFNGDGSMKTGWLKDSDGLWYYLDTNGAMVSNTKIDGYTINAKGVWISAN